MALGLTLRGGVTLPVLQSLIMKGAKMLKSRYNFFKIPNLMDPLIVLGTRRITLESIAM